MALDRDSYVKSLEALVASQAERIRKLEALAGLDECFDPPIEWKLVRREAQIFGMMAARDRVTKDAIHSVVYDDSPDVDPSVIESHVSRLRKKLSRFGVEICSSRYQGYWLVDRQKFRRAS